VLRTTLPWITRSAPFPPVSSRDARRCREPVSLPISTTEETHETLDIGLGLWPLSDLCLMKGCTGSLYRDMRPLRSKVGICPHNPNSVYLPISTTEETHETLNIGLGLWPLSDLCLMKGCTGSLYRDMRPLRSKVGI
jgi:hypothetical protein